MARYPSSFGSRSHLLRSSGRRGTMTGFMGGMKRATFLSGFSRTTVCISGWMAGRRGTQTKKKRLSGRELKNHPLQSVPRYELKRAGDLLIETVIGIILVTGY